MTEENKKQQAPFDWAAWEQATQASLAGRIEQEKKQERRRRKWPGWLRPGNWFGPAWKRDPISAAWLVLGSIALLAAMASSIRGLTQEDQVLVEIREVRDELRALRAELGMTPASDPAEEVGEGQ